MFIKCLIWLIYIRTVANSTTVQFVLDGTNWCTKEEHFM